VGVCCLDALQVFKVTKDELQVGSLEDGVVAKMAGMAC
jgi:hypothetical protein